VLFRTSRKTPYQTSNQAMTTSWSSDTLSSSSSESVQWTPWRTDKNTFIFPAERTETSTPHTFRVESCAERSNSRTYACERLCERRLQRGDNLPHKTTTRKMLMCLNGCMSSLPTLCSYWFTPTPQYTSHSPFIPPDQTQITLKLINILNFTSVWTCSYFLFAVCMLYRT
jgi:hypothetical protein